MTKGKGAFNVDGISKVSVKVNGGEWKEVKSQAEMQEAIRPMIEDSLKSVQEGTDEAMQIMKGNRKEANDMATGKKKTKQKDLENKEIVVDDVNENREPIEYVKVVLENDKFTLTAKDTQIDGLDPKGLEQLVRKKIRAKKDVEVHRGEMDDSADKFIRKLTA